ncbi:MAG: EscU/YscU/HrcU family type III secretion system export apparatus switch protein [Proteobacteria bacterium]|nr:EscU/YscU/HrcU family type III secretion system export apparatus switch protein [Pseudomonadota bacterium]
MSDSPDPESPNRPASTGRSLAIALAYAPGDTAPRIVAKGRGLIAEEIIRRAREYGVFVHESPELVTLLMQSNLDDRIPPQLYVAIAELLAWIYRLEQQQ